ncbi:MAG: efflux RND transporter permease subunit, partial [Pseudomonadales bacterium]
MEDIANIKLGPELRRGLAELNGEGEVAGGVVVMRFGENAMATIGRVREKLEELKASLPEGVEIVTTYDRRGLIERAIGTLSKTLSQVFVIVSLVCIVFLFHLRSSLVVIISLPIGVLIAFIVMKYLGINANIMSLGGIAITIGTMVDGAIVLIENTHKHLERRAAEKGTGLTTAERWQAVRAASVEVGPALFFTLVIITVSYIVIFSLQGQERRLFGPLAFTSTFSMAAAAILAVTLVPVLMGYLVRGKIIPESKNPINRGLHFVHSPIFGLALRWPRVSVLVAIALVAATWYPLSKLGSEFMPPIDEGDILYMPTTYPGISITKAKEILQQTDKILATFPEV